MMERKTKTTVDQLQNGDRFYKANDKNKDVYEKLSTHPLGSRKPSCLCLLACIADNQTQPWPYRLRFAASLKSDTEVIFLRHKTN